MSSTSAITDGPGANTITITAATVDANGGGAGNASSLGGTTGGGTGGDGIKDATVNATTITVNGDTGKSTTIDGGAGAAVDTCHITGTNQATITNCTVD